METHHNSYHNVYPGNIDPNTFREMVEERAYWKAKKRGLIPGNELNDWIEAEKEVSNQCRYWMQG